MDVFGASGILAVAIPFLVQQLKKVPFIGSKNAPIVAFVLGIAGGLVGYFMGYAPEGMSIIQAVMIGVGIGGVSTGLYDVAKKVT